MLCTEQEKAPKKKLLPFQFLEIKAIEKLHFQDRLEINEIAHILNRTYGGIKKIIQKIESNPTLEERFNKKCEYCRNEFTAKHPNQKCCSKACIKKRTALLRKKPIVGKDKQDIEEKRKLEESKMKKQKDSITFSDFIAYQQYMHELGQVVNYGKFSLQVETNPDFKAEVKKIVEGEKNGVACKGA